MILCCGEALIDMLPRKTAQGEDAFAPHVGGSVFNSALALGRLGAPVSFFSGLSSDLFGTRLQAALRDSRVDLSFAKFSDRPTTLAFVSLNDGQASYFFYDENSAGRMLTEQDLPELPQTVDVLLFGGISLATEPCGATYEALMTRERDGRVIMLDPNIRPVFITQPEAHKTRMRRMMAMADIVKISAEDLDWLGETGSHADVAQRMLETGAKLVLITGGAKGATAFWAGGSTTVEAMPVEVVDTVGAGDAFNAGVLLALREAGYLTKDALATLQEDTVREAVSFAARVAAATVARAGANPPWRDEL